MSRLAGVALVGMLMAGCGGGSSESRTLRTLSCDFAGEVCDSLVAQLTAAEFAGLQKNCVDSGGTFAPGACSTADKLAGHCQYTGAAATNFGIPYPGATLDEYYYPASWTLASAEAYCTSPPAGAWIP
jgi:hypothetical protein